ncbi:hypothetical protein ABQF33_12165 [Mycolicibacterium sp. XJ2]
MPAIDDSSSPRYVNAWARQSGADRVDDELCPFDGRSPVTPAVGCAGGDDVAFVQRTFLVTNGAIVGGASDCPDESAAEPQIELDAPLIVALAEVETVTVDRPAPLFGREPTMIVHAP